MSAALCVDASIAVKWLIWEEQSDLAIKLAQETRNLGDWLVGPPHLPVEVTSALYRRMREGDLTDYEAFEGAGTFAELPIEIVSPPALASKALELAAALDQRTPYDSFYLALGEILDCEVWTADERFYKLAQPNHARLHLLSDFR